MFALSFDFFIECKMNPNEYIIVYATQTLSLTKLEFKALDASRNNYMF